jgi:methionyl-tRNA formyltransferase
MTPLSLIFMGTPDFAVPSLRAIHAAGHPILQVVTQPDRPRGRGRFKVAPPVKKAAEDLNCPVLQPESIKDVRFLRQLEALRPDVIVVIAFGQLLPSRLVHMAPMGTINVHGSVLPRYRGPAPIQWAIINGESETGVTTMLMDEGVDTGDILLVERSPIFPTDTSQDLHDRLSTTGAGLIVKTLADAGAGRLSPIPQDDGNASYAPMLKKADGRINWDQPPQRIDAFVRGMSPWPGAFTTAEGRHVKIFRVAPAPMDVAARPGTVIEGFSDEIRVAARGGALRILELQTASGKRLPVADFLRGHTLAVGRVLG